ncbi:asparaginase [Gracilibacillus dipsosauri]|uniref:asparaginase n=1 Tax=Gracilibacillus dipsosauri TaxID=178340 RepID=UPI0024093828
MKEILVIHTGGTISMVQDHEGHVGSSENHPLLDKVQSTDFTIREIELFSLPSPHITPNHMLKLAQFVESNIQETTRGVVITHGTDTLEETAYFLDLTLSTSIPIVLTGAMRSSNDVGSDGLYNLLCSIQVASYKKAGNHGVLIVFNDEIHTAKYVTKTSTSNVSTFKSPPVGPIGFVNKKSINFYQLLTDEKEYYQPKQLTRNVFLIKAFTGMSPSILSCLCSQEVDGLVIEGFGQGNVPPDILPALKQLIDYGITIVLVTRCYQGRVQPTYNYKGGGKTLQDIGVIFANHVNGPKARIKLMLLLEQGATTYELEQAFCD